MQNNGTGLRRGIDLAALRKDIFAFFSNAVIFDSNRFHKCSIGLLLNFLHQDIKIGNVFHYHPGFQVQRGAPAGNFYSQQAAFMIEFG